MLRAAAFACWRLDAGLGGTTFFGVPDTRDVARLVECWSVRRADSGYTSIIDARRLEAIDRHAFRRMVEVVRGRSSELGDGIARQALVCPDDELGAAVAGFAALYGPGYPVEVFSDLGSALRCCGRDADLADEVERLSGVTDGVSPELLALRSWLLDLEVLAVATPELAARALRVSTRTLQRRLAGGETTFHAELASARMAAARGLLSNTAEKVAWVGRVVGFASEQHFGKAFRGHTEGRSRARAAFADRVAASSFA